MLNNIQKLRDRKSQEGFTIIEVMIVLAIAGLIILVVLLAVPALQRNSRNTAIKNDASAVASALSEYASNNDGGAATGVANTSAGSSTVDVTGTGTPAQAKVQTGTEVSSETAAAATVAPTAAKIGVGKIDVVLKGKCNGNAALTYSARSTAVFYQIETSGAPATRCVDA